MNTETKLAVLTVDATVYGLAEVTANEIAAKFTPVIEKMAEYEPEFQEVMQLDINDPATAKKAAELRRKYVKVRTATGHLHKQEKEASLKIGKYLDAWKNAQAESGERIETALENIEKNAERLEKERIAAIQKDREEMLAPYEVANTHTMNLSGMDETMWLTLLAGYKKAYQDKLEQSKKEAEEQAERERVAEEKRQEMARENARLRAEAEAKEKELAEERAKAEADRKAAEQEAARLKAEAEAKEKAERERVDREFAREKARVEAEQKRMREEAEKKLAAERAERERVEAELKAKAEAEAQRLAAIEAREQAELAKGDSAKLEDLKNDLQALITKYEFKSKKHQLILSQVASLLAKIINHIISKQ